MVLQSPIMFIGKVCYNSEENARQEKLHMISHVTAGPSGVMFKFIPLNYALLSLFVRIMFSMPFLAPLIIITSNLLCVHNINASWQGDISVYRQMSFSSFLRLI